MLGISMGIGIGICIVRCEQNTKITEKNLRILLNSHNWVWHRIQ